MSSAPSQKKRDHNFDNVWTNLSEVAKNRKLSLDVVQEIFTNAIKIVISKIDPDLEIEENWIKTETKQAKQEKLLLFSNKEVFEGKYPELLTPLTRNGKCSPDEEDLIKSSFIKLEEALEIDSNAKVGDIIRAPIPYMNFSPNNVKKISQLLYQNLAIAVKKRIINAYKNLIGEKIRVKVETKTEKWIRVSFVEDPFVYSALPTHEYDRMKLDLNLGNEFNVYIKEVIAEPSRDQNIVVITTTPSHDLINLLKNTYSEIENGEIEIKKISRRLGQRSKVAVSLKENLGKEIDVLETLIGYSGIKNKSLKEELKEDVDFVLYDENLHDFICNALSPAKVISVEEITLAKKDSRKVFDIIVPDSMVSLAIGKKGLNVSLISDLVNARINIKAYSDAVAEKEAQNQTINWNGNVLEAELALLELDYSNTNRVSNKRRKERSYYDKSNYDISGIIKDIQNYQEYFNNAEDHEEISTEETSTETKENQAQEKRQKKRSLKNEMNNYLDNLTDNDFNMINEEIASTKNDSSFSSDKRAQVTTKETTKKKNAIIDYQISDNDFRDFALEDIDLDDLDDENWK